MYAVEHNNALRSTECTYILFLLIYIKQNGVSSTKIILANQARSINQHKNLRRNVLQTFISIVNVLKRI